MSLSVHARATATPGAIRLWVGLIGREESENLRFFVDEAELQPEEVVRQLEPSAHWAPSTQVRSGLFEFHFRPAARRQHTIKVTSPTSTTGDEVTTRTLPARLPSGPDNTGNDGYFRVLLVSCYSQPRDKDGAIGDLVRQVFNGPEKPDLILTVGDQVYLDNPFLRHMWARDLSADELASEFETKYINNWTGAGYAALLKVAPVAGIPDDHEYWNNYPHPSRISPQTRSDVGRERWRVAARAMFDAFQFSHPENTSGDLGQHSYRLDIAPLSLFMLDNRTHRTDKTTMSEPDREEFKGWVQDVIQSGLYPVLITGPSLFQPPTKRYMRWMDRNFADFEDYGEIMEALFVMAERGRPVLSLTGDVHYGRITRGTFPVPTLQDTFHRGQISEVISSPSALVAPFPQRLAPGLREQPFHPAFTVGRSLDCEMLWPTTGAQWGNHVAMLKFKTVGTSMGAAASRAHLNLPYADDEDDDPRPATETPIGVDVKTSYWFTDYRQGSRFRHYEAPTIHLTP